MQAISLGNKSLTHTRKNWVPDLLFVMGAEEGVTQGENAEALIEGQVSAPGERGSLQDTKSSRFWRWDGVH